MKRMEVKHFEEFTRKYYPNFKLANDELVSTWVSELARFPLKGCERGIAIYYARSKTRYEPTLAQLKELLEENEVKPLEPTEKVEPDYGLKYQKLDKENGDMNWLVPHYSEVWRQIKRDRWPFVVNIYHPTHEEFRECMKRWSRAKFGREYFCLSDNDIEKLDGEEKKALEQGAAAFRGIGDAN